MPIPGTTKLAHLDDNVRAMKEVEPLSEAERAAVAACVPASSVQGNRYAGGNAKRGTYKANM